MRVLIKIIIPSSLLSNLLPSSQGSPSPPSLRPSHYSSHFPCFDPYNLSWKTSSVFSFLPLTPTWPVSCQALTSHNTQLFHLPILHLSITNVQKLPSLARVKLSLKLWEIEEKDNSPAMSFGRRELRTCTSKLGLILWWFKYIIYIYILFPPRFISVFMTLLSRLK